MKKILVVLLLMGWIQTGCVAGAFAAGGATTGSFATDPRSFETIQEDEQITYQATRLLASNKALVDDAHVTAVSYNRVVLLTGETPNAQLRSEAAKIVQQVPGVKRIFNEIVIGESVSAYELSKDAMVTANVKARMLATTNLKSNEFKVVTENGTVFLLGLSSRKQANIAAEVARNSHGVKRVVKLVEYPAPEDS